MKELTVNDFIIGQTVVHSPYENCPIDAKEYGEVAGVGHTCVYVKIGAQLELRSFFPDELEIRG